MTKDNKTIIYAAKYPVTNIQYERFLKAPDFGEKDLWMNFPKYDETSHRMKESWEDEGWEWLQQALRDKDLSPDGKMVYPRYWNEPTFGIVRKSVPVVGVSCYEANAYCKWLLKHWKEYEEGRANNKIIPASVRLPTEVEWVELAGGDQPEGRYPWDKDREATSDPQEILKRANTSESKIAMTSPVGMYPLGASQLGLQDMAGNVWEWQANYQSIKDNQIGLRGGSWLNTQDNARVAIRHGGSPDGRSYFVGFRVVFPPS